MKETLGNLKQVLKTTNNSMLSKANVVATGIGYKYVQGKKTKELCIICSVTEKKPVSQLTTADSIPSTLNGLATDVVQSGVIRAQQFNGRYRPAPGGVSIGHADITAGTLGCLVKKNGGLFILSNNHVLANSNAAQRGDAILQPGPIDGGTLPADLIAHLEDFVKIDFGNDNDGGGGGGDSGCGIANSVASFLNGTAGIMGSHARLKAISTQVVENLVDAAIAKPVDRQDVDHKILEIGAIQGTTTGELGLAIKKSGRTTEFTTGEILQIEATVNVQYGPGKVARFTDQLVAGGMSQGGDSGSAVLSKNDQLVGLLFAGSENSTIINRIENVFSTLGVSL
ncbi:MAG: hypothetical protein GXP08_05725 [Gammaproteobacteria bacterium]|nr:hypothetical protein [Gammaproteobacteria bacterium]